MIPLSLPAPPRRAAATTAESSRTSSTSSPARLLQSLLTSSLVCSVSTIQCPLHSVTLSASSPTLLSAQSSWPHSHSTLRRWRLRWAVLLETLCSPTFSLLRQKHLSAPLWQQLDKQSLFVNILPPPTTTKRKTSKNWLRSWFHIRLIGVFPKMWL